MAAGMGVVVAAGVAAAPPALENGVEEVAEAGIPVRVPEDIAAAVVDSPAAAAMAATLADTLTVFEVVAVVDVLEPDDVVLEVTSWPPEVGKTAAAPESAEVGTGFATDAAGVVGGVVLAVVPRVATDAAAPVVVLALM